MSEQSPNTESNRRPSPYHGDALPTELLGHSSSRRATRSRVEKDTRSRARTRNRISATALALLPRRVPPSVPRPTGWSRPTSGRAPGGGSAGRRGRGSPRGSPRPARGTSAAAALPRACATLRAPGMTVETPGCCDHPAQGALAGSDPLGQQLAEGGRGIDARVEVDPGERLADVERLAVAVVGAVVVVGEDARARVYLPDSRPEASGTRAMMPTPAAAAAGSTWSSGLSRNALRMICTVATCPAGRSRPAPGRTVSTLTP